MSDRNEPRPTPAINFLRKRVEDGLPLYQGDIDSALAEARLPLLEEIGRLHKSIRILQDNWPKAIAHPMDRASFEEPQDE